MKIDLHIHTTASDGTWTPEELLTEAKKVGLGALAVTDHDSVGNVLATQQLARVAGLKFLTGVELNSTKAGLNFHVLGYGLDIENKALQELMANNIQLLEDVDVGSIALLEKEGWPVSVAEFAH